MAKLFAIILAAACLTAVIASTSEGDDSMTEVFEPKLESLKFLKRSIQDVSNKVPEGVVLGKPRTKRASVRPKAVETLAQEASEAKRTYAIRRNACVAWGDPHIKPLTGPLFDIQRQGVYTALKYGQFKVQTWHKACGGVVRWHGVSTKYRVSCGKGWAVQVAHGLVFSASERSRHVKLNGANLGGGWKTFKGSRVLNQGHGRIRIINSNFDLTLRIGHISIALRNKSLLGKLSGFCGGGHEYAARHTHLRFPCRDCIRGGYRNQGLCECKKYFHGSNQNPRTLFPPTDHVQLVSWKKRIQKNLKPNPARFNTFVRQCKNTIHTGPVGK
jgi:hypothetical protein